MCQHDYAKFVTEAVYNFHLIARNFTDFVPNSVCKISFYYANNSLWSNKNTLLLSTNGM
jgi:hypothetical protein